MLLKNTLKKIRKFFQILIFVTLLPIQIIGQNGWTQKSDIPISRVAATASVINDQIFLIGGWTFSGHFNTNQMYNPSTDTWETLKSMPTPRGYVTSVVVDGIIYVIGGGYPTPLKKVEAYDPITDTWTTKKDMNVARTNGRAAVVDGKIFVFAGYSEICCCEFYDPHTDTWTNFADFPESCGGVVAVAVHNELIYVFGGGYSIGLNTLYTYDPRTDTWERKCDMLRGRTVSQVCIVNEKMYLIGGAKRVNVSTSAVDMYDPSTDTWHNKSNMPYASAFLSCAVVNDKIYVFEGSPDWSTGGVRTWEYDPSLDQVVSVEPKDNEPTKLLPKFNLCQNYPNPFNPSTTIKYSIPIEVRGQISEVRLIVYDILGREVAILVNEKQKPGNYEVLWEGTNQPSGVYFYQLKIAEYQETKKMILLR